MTLGKERERESSPLLPCVISVMKAMQKTTSSIHVWHVAKERKPLPVASDDSELPVTHTVISQCVHCMLTNQQEALESPSFLCH